MAEYHLKIKELPPNEQPRERLRDHGAGALSDSELLAILLRVGVEGTNVLQLAQHLLVEHGGWAGLQRLDYHSLCNKHGIGQAKAATIQAALEIGRRLLISEHAERFQIKSPIDAAQLLMIEMGHLDQEHLRTVLLDTKNRVQSVATVYVGSLNASMVRVGEVFKAALRQNSAALIVAHNHPSGDPTPSPVIWRMLFVKSQSVADRRSLPILPDRSRPRQVRVGPSRRWRSAHLFYTAPAQP